MEVTVLYLIQKLYVTLSTSSQKAWSDSSKECLQIPITKEKKELSQIR